MQLCDVMFSSVSMMEDASVAPAPPPASAPAPVPAPGPGPNSAPSSSSSSSSGSASVSVSDARSSDSTPIIDANGGSVSADAAGPAALGVPGSVGAGAGAGASAGAVPRARAPSARSGKHPLLPSAILPPMHSGVGLAVMLSPGSEAKRARTGDHTPGGSALTTAQWASDVPMSPATAMLQQAFGGVNLASGTPRGGKSAGAASPSPVRDASAALPPTHPYIYPSSPAKPVAGSGSSPGLSFPHAMPSAAGLAALSAVSNAAVMSPPRSNQSSSASASASSSPSSAFSTAPTGAPHSSHASSHAAPTSPGSVSPEPSSTATAHTLALAAPPPSAVASQPVAPSTSRRAAAQMSASPPDIDEEDDDGGKKKGDNRQGASCHQCKTTKDEQHLLFCTTKAGGARKRRCRKKYCDSCLSRTYGVHMSQLLNDPHAMAHWQCPSCAGKCTCAGCTRKVHTHTGSRGANATHAAMASPVHLDSSPPANKGKAGRQAHSRGVVEAVDPQQQEWDNVPSIQGAYISPTHAAIAQGQVLPVSNYMHSRAVSAPDFHFQPAQTHPFLYAQNPHFPLPVSHTGTGTLSEAAHAIRSGGMDEAADIASSSSATTVRSTTAAAPETSPVHMDAIASLLLELSTASSTASTSSDASTIGATPSEMASVSTVPVVSEQSHSQAPALSPQHAAAQAVEQARTAALLANRHAGNSSTLASLHPGVPVSSMPAASPSASSSSAAPSATAAYPALLPSTRFPGAPLMSMLQSSTAPMGLATSFGVRSHMPPSGVAGAGVGLGMGLPLQQRSLQTKYSALMQGAPFAAQQPATQAISGNIAMLPAAPVNGPRALSEAAGAHGWMRAYAPSQPQ